MLTIIFRIFILKNLFQQKQDPEEWALLFCDSKFQRLSNIYSMLFYFILEIFA